MLKPGGELGVIDHVGVAGEDNAALHRMQLQQARDAIVKAGFTIEAESTPTITRRTSSTPPFAGGPISS